ncbi:radical SAM protein [Mucilaginibacter calamicampi]|uniref:Radical SAM protein n=1 Tax=Mucilaginibacter calamicampi TaxID=1302352 RepID=A0ABW2YW66_9SPHI
MATLSLYNTYQRYRTLQSDKISALPLVILMPHSACNCRCVMCDIWKDNKNLKQLTEEDITGLLISLKKLGTQRVLISGGEALLNPNFFRLCQILKEQRIKISLLTTGLSIKQNADQLIKWVDDLIVSLDGDEPLHDEIRAIPNAFKKLKDGVQYLKALKPDYRVTARTVIHRLNFRQWPAIIQAAKTIGVDQISFLPADVSSHAFNRQTAWAEPRQHEILIGLDELPELSAVIAELFEYNKDDFENGYIAESIHKIYDIYQYYAAFYGLNPFPFKKCNAPWVSTVIEADGSVRPCFFHDAIGNIRDAQLLDILNSEPAINFRKQLDMATNATCVKCVCTLNLSPLTQL